MSPERLREVQRVFDAVADVPPGERDAALAERCAGDAELEAEVRRLLDLEAAAGEGGPSIREVVRAAASARGEQLIGSTIGPYRLLKTLGEGGFGVVYLAEQDQPVKRKVALKLIRPELLQKEDAALVRARFELERETLKLLAHPGIAKIYDAGTTEGGVPFFAMEYVAGEPITAFCDRERLNIKARLELFGQVCDAVQHAHANGVIHRDLSPSNVLVSMEEGTPRARVIDFGVAKAVNATLAGIWTGTITGQAIGKLEYMSPEQAINPRAGVDIRADVYSLGVILYELLTGLRPFDLQQEALAAVMKTIEWQDPPKPSTRLESLSGERREEFERIVAQRGATASSLSRALESDLGYIPLKAMQKERGRRYASAADFAEDVRAYLEGASVSAHPDSAWYRLRKFVRKNKGPVAAVAAVVCALVLGFGTALWQARNASRQRDAALLAQADLAVAVVDYTAGDPVNKLEQAWKLREIAGATDDVAAAHHLVLIASYLAGRGDELGVLDRVRRAEAILANPASSDRLGTMTPIIETTGSGWRRVNDRRGVLRSCILAKITLYDIIGNDVESLRQRRLLITLIVEGGHYDPQEVYELRMEAARIAIRVSSRDAEHEFASLFVEASQFDTLKGMRGNPTINALILRSEFLEQIGRISEARDDLVGAKQKAVDLALDDGYIANLVSHIDAFDQRHGKSH